MGRHWQSPLAPGILGHPPALWCFAQAVLKIFHSIETETFPVLQVLAKVEMEMFNFVWNRIYNSQTSLFRIDMGCCNVHSLM